MSSQMAETYEECKKIRNGTKALVKQTNDKYWEISKGMETDFCGPQKQIWRLIRNQRAEANKLISAQQIEKYTYIKHLKGLYKREETEYYSNSFEVVHIYSYGVVGFVSPYV